MAIGSVIEQGRRLAIIPLRIGGALLQGYTATV
jgi:hypothetical protein